KPEKPSTPIVKFKETDNVKEKEKEIEVIAAPKDNSSVKRNETSVSNISGQTKMDTVGTVIQSKSSVKPPAIFPTEKKEIKSEIFEPVASTYHIVKQGESLYKIAKLYNT